MFGNIENMIQQAVSGNVDSGSLGQAASEHVSQMDGDEVRQHVEDAANTAQQNGQSNIAEQLMGMVSRHQADPEALKGAAISYIRENPQVLSHFAPGFAQGILSRVL